MPFKLKTSHLDKNSLTPRQEALLPILFDAFVEAAAMLEDNPKVITYYIERMKVGRMFMPYDYGAIEKMRLLDPKARVWDIGACLGVFSFMMAAEGREVIAVDSQPNCKFIMEHAKKVVDKHDPGIAEKITIVTGFFPHIDLSNVRKNDIAVALGCPIYEPDEPHDPEKDRLFRIGINKFKYSLIDFKFHPRDGRELKDFSVRQKLFTQFKPLSVFSYSEGFAPSVYVMKRKWRKVKDAVATYIVGIMPISFDMFSILESTALVA